MTAITLNSYLSKVNYSTYYTILAVVTLKGLLLSAVSYTHLTLPTKA